MDLSTLKTRIDSLLLRASAPGGELAGKITEVFQGALTVMSSVYGPESHQVSALLDLSKTVKFVGGNAYQMGMFLDSIEGSLRNLKQELDAGLIGTLQKSLTSGVLTDFVQLARMVLEEPFVGTKDGAKNVAAVLAAAAFEDTVRRMGSIFTGVMGKDDLSNVIDALKVKGVLVSPQLGIAISFLNFRNKALHANWNEIDRASVNSVLAFVQDLLLKHFQ
jgi:hypothetical protein